MNGTRIRLSRLLLGGGIAALLPFALSLTGTIPVAAAAEPAPTVTGPIKATVEPGDPSHDYIYSAGGTRDYAEAYRLFRGRDPKIDALLEGRGLAA